MLIKLMKESGILMILLTSAGSFQALAQNRAISGKVVDAGGQPIIGAGVVVPGTASSGPPFLRLASGEMLRLFYKVSHLL